MPSPISYSREAEGGLGQKRRRSRDGGAGDQGAGKQSGRDVAISQGMPGTTEAGRGQEWILSWSP